MTQGWATVSVVLAAGLWGLFWIPVRLFEAKGISGEWAVIALYLPAALVLIPVVWRDWQAQRAHVSEALWVGGLIGSALGLYGVSILYTTVVQATLLFYLTPVWASVLGFFWLKEPPHWTRWAAIVTGLVGLNLLISSEGAVSFGIGDVLALVSGALWALGTTLIKHRGALPVAGMTLSQFLFSTVTVACLAVLWTQPAVPDLASATGLMVATVLASLLLALPAITLLFRASQVMSPGRVGLLMMSEVLVAVVTASLFLPEETLTLQQWGGAALIIGSSLLEILGNRVQPAEANPNA